MPHNFGFEDELTYQDMEAQFASMDDDAADDEGHGSDGPRALVFGPTINNHECRDRWEVAELDLPFVQPSFALFDSEKGKTDDMLAADLGNFVQTMAPWGKLVMAPVIEVDDGTGHRREEVSALKYIYEPTQWRNVYRIVPLFMVSTTLTMDAAKIECLKLILRELLRMMRKHYSGDKDIPEEMATSLNAWIDPTNRDMSTTDDERLEKAFATYVDNYMNSAPAADPNADDDRELAAYHTKQFEKVRNGEYGRKIDFLRNPLVHIKQAAA